MCGKEEQINAFAMHVSPLYWSLLGPDDRTRISRGPRYEDLSIPILVSISAESLVTGKFVPFGISFRSVVRACVRKIEIACVH